jgi:hypothetical protein
MSLRRVQILSPNYSSRGGAAVRLVVLHTAQGATTYDSLGAFFASPDSGVSSHVGIDDTPGTIGEYVYRPNKAWTAAGANPVAVQAELCAFAEWDPAEWDRHPEMLANTAAWIAEECAHFDIPIVKLTPAQAQGSGRGVCQHADLGAWGGGHWDCGSFPIDRVLEMARGGAPTPTPPREEDIVAIATGLNSADALHVFVEAKDGSIWYTWQRKGETAWQGGKPGKSTAELQPFAPAPK